MAVQMPLRLEQRMNMVIPPPKVTMMETNLQNWKLVAWRVSGASSAKKIIPMNPLTRLPPVGRILKEWMPLGIFGTIGV